MELSDVKELGELQALEAQLADLLAAEDVEHLAAAMDTGSTAGVPIWEKPLGCAVRSSSPAFGGQLIATGRIPHSGDHRLHRGGRSNCNCNRRRLNVPVRRAGVGRV
jgi:hypothetical protein